MAGDDGSLTFSRYFVSSGATTVVDSRQRIWHGGVETSEPYGGLIVYFNRRNYAGSFQHDSGPGMPTVAPDSYIVVNGHFRGVGIGDVEYWGRDGELVLSVPVNKELRPSGPEDKAGEVVRLLWRGSERIVPEHDYLGTFPDGTVVLRSKPEDDLDPVLAVSDKSGHSNAMSVLLWRRGKWCGRWKVPAGWYAASVGPLSAVLLRRTATLASVGEAKPDGLSSQAALVAAQKDGDRWEDAVTRAERDWHVALLRRGSFSQVLFNKPNDAGLLMWRDKAFWVDTKCFSFVAWYGADIRAYRVDRAR